MGKGAEKFKKIAKKVKVPIQIITFSFFTRTAAEAARAIGCQIAQIAKSIVFRTASGKPILMITSGTNRVDENKLEKILGERIEKADAEFVKKFTGYAIGGVPPFGHESDIRTFIDEDLFKFSEIWAAAGDGFSVFRISAEKLKEITNGEIINVKVENNQNF